jgi:IS1 family transposase
MTTLDSFQEATREAKGKRLYELWLYSGQTHTVATEWESLPSAEQARWIWLAKARPDPQHQHHVEPPRDVQHYPEATLVPRRPEMWDYDTRDVYPYARANATDAFYTIWVEMRQARLRKHWWQFTRPTTIDTSRKLFDQQVKSYLKVARPEATADL